MIVVDTNVLSETARPEPDPRVLTWLFDHRHELAIASCTVGELFYGVHRLPVGRRRTSLMAAVEEMVVGAQGRVLPYDEAAARTYGTIRADREAQGLVASVEDLQIAAIALSGGHSVATRNVKDFAGTGVEVIDPWEA